MNFRKWGCEVELKSISNRRQTKETTEVPCVFSDDSLSRYRYPALL